MACASLRPASRASRRRSARPARMRYLVLMATGVEGGCETPGEAGLTLMSIFPMRRWRQAVAA